jgi:ABC-type dipeptide/oligopeptide/nickel transport system ATPase subunit
MLSMSRVYPPVTARPCTHTLAACVDVSLSLQTIDALISAIQNYGGGLLFVSHDQNFLQSVGSEFWSVSNQQVKRFDSFEASKKFSYAAS